MVVLTDGTNVFGNTSNDLGSTYSSYGYLVDGRARHRQPAAHRPPTR